ncbi:MAG: DUF975 family protein [Ruminococcaceae bacterium]|nr:DUF975 family protein [Oscillospiraceae bacterium]
MPVFIDNRAVREEARTLMHSAAVSPFLFTAMFLAINLVLDLVNTAANYMLGRTVEVSSVSMTFSFVGILVSLLATVLLAGYAFYGLGVQSGREMSFESLFAMFPFAGKVVLLTVVQGVLIGVGLALFIVPGLVLALAYSFALYHLCEDPDASVLAALRRSRLEMNGYKLQLLALILGFLPLLLLFAVPVGLCEYFLESLFPETLVGELMETLVSGVLTGFAAVYMTPYMALSQIIFYRRVLAAHEPDADGGAFGEE